jgi:hypothetical protein
VNLQDATSIEERAGVSHACQPVLTLLTNGCNRATIFRGCNQGHVSSDVSHAPLRLYRLISLR